MGSRGAEGCGHGSQFWTKIAITDFVWRIATRLLVMEGGLTFRPTKRRYCHCRYTATKGRCHGNHFWLSIGAHWRHLANTFEPSMCGCEGFARPSEEGNRDRQDLRCAKTFVLVDLSLNMSCMFHYVPCTAYSRSWIFFSGDFLHVLLIKWKSRKKWQ